MVALVTPMTMDGAVDEKALAELVQFHIDNRTDAIVVVGTTGESSTLSEKEHCKTIKFVVDEVNNQIPVIAGTGANNTQEAIDLTQCAMNSGADAALLVTPYYNKPTQEGLYQHYKKVAESVAIPQVLYNVPGRTAVDLLPETVLRLADISNIVGIKEATGDVERGAFLVKELGDRMDVYSGDDKTAMELILNGAKGDISVTANVAPKLMHEMCQFALEGDRQSAEEVNNQLDILHDKLFVESNPIPVKWALYEMGMIGTGIRLPLTPLGEQYHAVIRDALRQSGIIT